jgi:hypothetical protein
MSPIVVDSPQPRRGLFSQTAVLRYAGGPTGDYDDYGNPTVGERHEVPTPAWWEPRTSGEQTVAQQQVTSGYWLYLPEHTDLTAVDAVILMGEEYEVDGEPGRQPGGFVIEGYVKTAVKRVTG